MVFNSITFLIFATIVLTVYYRLGHRGQNILLLVASYVFYGWWDWRFLGLLLFSTLFDYWCALWLENQPDLTKRRIFLSFSMIVNLGILCLFKYFNFFAGSLEHVLHFFGMKASFPMLHVILPVGISFYTFLSMSYTIDVFRGEMKAARNPLDYMLYVAFFPHLVAGPIVRASFLLPQCQHARTIKANEVVNGIWQILMGYIKKVVIADRLADIVTWGFSRQSPPFADANAWVVIYAFAFQIYGDFAGYSDIARGLSKLMGFELVTNFRAPYLVTNPSAFWQNWHISLSTWLRDYLYIPLGGNRRGPWRTYANLMTTMVLGGLWHGAGAAYLLWGLYHGLLLSVHRAWQGVTEKWSNKGSSDAAARQPRPRFGLALKSIVLVLLFFHLTCIGWLLFRAGSISPRLDQVQIVLNYLRAMFHWPLGGRVTVLAWPVMILGGLAIFFQWQHEKMDHFSTWKTHWKAAASTLALSVIIALGVFKGSQFIYFQF